MKKILSVLLLTAIMSTLSPVAFAKTDSAALNSDLSEEKNIESEESVVNDSYVPYYSPISFSISLTSTIKATKASLSGDYSVNSLESREAVSVKLTSKYNEVKSAFAKYGKITRSYTSIYEDYADPYATTTSTTKSKTYSGNVSLLIILNNINNYQTVYDELITSGLNVYGNIEIDEEAKIDLESSLASKINSLIQKKKKIYEKILGKSLGKITSLYLDTWPDSITFDSETGMVKVTVTANVNY